MCKKLTAYNMEQDKNTSIVKKETCAVSQQEIMLVLVVMAASDQWVSPFSPGFSHSHPDCCDCGQWFSNCDSDSGSQECDCDSGSLTVIVTGSPAVTMTVVFRL